MSRFNRRGKTGVFYIPESGIAATDGIPTQAEIEAGQPLHNSIQAITGFTSTQEDLPVPDLGSDWNGTIPGGQTAAESGLTFYAGDEDADPEEVIRAALPEGDGGTIVFSKRSKSPVADDPIDLFPVRIKASNDQYTADNGAALFNTGFSLPDPPKKNVAVAAPAGP